MSRSLVEYNATTMQRLHVSTLISLHDKWHDTMLIYWHPPLKRDGDKFSPSLLDLITYAIHVFHSSIFVYITLIFFSLAQNFSIICLVPLPMQLLHGMQPGAIICNCNAKRARIDATRRASHIAWLFVC